MLTERGGKKLAWVSHLAASAPLSVAGPESSILLVGMLSSTNFVTNPSLVRCQVCEGVRAWDLSLLCASGDFGDSEDLSVNCEARLYSGRLGVASPSACLFQVPLLCDMFALLFRQRSILCWSCCKVDPTFACPQSWRRRAIGRRTPEYFSCAHVLTCYLAFFVRCPSGEEPPFRPLGLIIERKCLRETKVS